MRETDRNGSRQRAVPNTPGARRRSRQPRCVQAEPFARTWGGKREGSGRKGRGPRSLVAHRPRATFRPRCPVHVTLRLADGLPNPRMPETYRALLTALGGGSERFGMRLVHWSVLGNHMHLIVEAADLRALSRGMQGLGVRIARTLNRCWRRTGRVLADRFHARPLPSPREVRTALAYVLHNARKHRLRAAGVDPCSSGPWFDGWREGVCCAEVAVERPGWLRAAGTWLLARSWRRLGLLDVDEWPAGP
jgi:REP element-mobilizing transposase RayT